MTEKNLGTEAIRWDLSCFYTGIDDPRIERDVELCIRLMRHFKKTFNGKLSSLLGEAITAYEKLVMLEEKIFVYLFLLKSKDQTDEAVKTKLDQCEKNFRRETGECLTFFRHELTRLPDAHINRQALSNTTVAFHLSWISDVRKLKPHLLSEEVEVAISKRSLFGSESWSKFYEETEAELLFHFEGKRLTQNEILDIASEDPDEKRRAEALATVNETLGKQFAPLAAQTLNTVIGEKQIEDRERGYKHPMEARNKENGVPDKAVEALHRTTGTVGAELARRYYLLKSKFLKKYPLAWSDRNAPLPFKSTNIIPYPEALALVLGAYESFSLALADIIREMIAQKRIDAHAGRGRHSGAFNYPLVLPGNVPACFTFMNYLGTEGDVMTLAHELGHAIHGILAGKAQGVLMQSAPIALAETASIFGEMTTFNFLKAQLMKKGDVRAVMALNMEKLGSIMNTVIRQISFSNFEQRVHTTPRRLSVQEFNAIWLEETKKIYGDMFTYKDCEYLWTYIQHFHRPFYVYGYAFGELLTQSLYANQTMFPKEKFEEMYLDLLRAGSSRGVKDLLAPFNLDPERGEFWEDGFKPVEALLRETETLATENNLI